MNNLISIPGEIAVAILAPVGWLGSLWQGHPHEQMSRQLPIFGSWNDFGPAAIALVIVSVLILIYGGLTNEFHKASRVAMVTVALALYLAVLALPLPYMVARSLLSAIAIAFIFGARFYRPVRPAKTVLFFIGVGFTTESIAWSLANSTASMTAFGILTGTAFFFSRVDKKRARKAAAISATSFVAFAVAVAFSLIH